MITLHEIARRKSPTYNCRSIQLSVAAFVSAFTLIFFVSGCGGSGSPGTTTLPPGLPQPPTPAAINTYTGSQSPGIATVTLNDTANTFSYTAVPSESTTVSTTTGTTASANGFLKLTSANANAAGYALEIPGRLALLRPGDSTAALVAAVPSTSCLPIGGYVTFLLSSMAEATGGNEDYGQIVASTSTNGASYTFGDQFHYIVEEVPKQQLDTVPTSFSAACATNNGVAAITVPATNAVPVSPTIWIGPSGFFVEDQTGISTTNNQEPEASLVGVPEPSASLTTSAIAVGTYLGFSSPAVNSVTTTYLVSFGASSSSTTSLAGGAFSSDDPTQTAATNITISFGAQDSSLYGYYPSVTVTEPDPNQNCKTDGGTPGYDVNQNPICTSPAIAVVSNPEGKYAIFLSEQDYALGNAFVGYFLLQQ